ncbi:MAG: DUF4124 domain-containing protein [Candidatus Lindowbacteria bacterium]|nr:DUF4124 domain-containing protein [Candidatus Lindowbacteria bacterium]
MERFRGSVCKLGAFAILFVFLIILPSHATIYAYTDSQGRIRITDIPEKKGREVVLQPSTASKETISRISKKKKTRNSYPKPWGSGNRDRGAERYDKYVEEASEESGSLRH